MPTMCFKALTKPCNSLRRGDQWCPSMMPTKQKSFDSALEDVTFNSFKWGEINIGFLLLLMDIQCFVRLRHFATNVLDVCNLFYHVESVKNEYV